MEPKREYRTVYARFAAPVRAHSEAQEEAESRNRCGFQSQDMSRILHSSSHVSCLVLIA
jgi:hypothetical protein